MVCVENVASKATKEPLPDGVNESKRISDAAEAMGLMVRPIGHLNVMSPPLTITGGQVDFVVETLEKAIRKVTDELVREGQRIGCGAGVFEHSGPEPLKAPMRFLRRNRVLDKAARQGFLGPPGSARLR